MSAIIEEFPYFQSARAIYLKGLKDLGVSNTIKNSKQRLPIQPIERYCLILLLLKYFYKMIFRHISNKILIKSKQLKLKNFRIFLLQSSDLKDDSESKLELGKPYSLIKPKPFHFLNGFELTQKKPIDRSESSEPEEESNRDKKFALIDAFISNKPKLKPLDKDSKLINIAEDSVFETEDLMTETLARIYVEQKNYDKAIQSYRILSLKYPEKSSLFADQIQAIKVLQEKNNL